MRTQRRARGGGTRTATGEAAAGRLPACGHVYVLLPRGGHAGEERPATPPRLVCGDGAPQETQRRGACSAERHARARGAAAPRSVFPGRCRGVGRAHRRDLARVDVHAERHDWQSVQHGDGDPEEEEQKVPEVATADAVVDVGAVVVHLDDACVAHAAVVRVWWLGLVTPACAACPGERVQLCVAPRAPLGGGFWHQGWRLAMRERRGSHFSQKVKSSKEFLAGGTSLRSKKSATLPAFLNTAV